MLFVLLYTLSYRWFWSLRKREDPKLHCVIIDPIQSFDHSLSPISSFAHSFLFFSTVPWFFFLSLTAANFLSTLLLCMAFLAYSTFWTNMPCVYACRILVGHVPVILHSASQFFFLFFFFYFNSFDASYNSVRGGKKNIYIGPLFIVIIIFLFSTSLISYS